RDTPELLQTYVNAFDNKHAIGLSGTPAQIESVASRYRVSYQILAPKNPSDTNYEVSHSKGVFVFNQHGRVNLLVPDIESPGSVDALVVSLKKMIAFEG